MANLLDAAIPKILSQGLIALRENAIVARLVNNDFSADAQRKGSSVDVPIPSSMGTADDVIPSANNSASTDVTPTFVPIVLDRWKQKKFHMTDQDIKEVMDGYLNLQVTEAARAIANTVDRDILMLYKKIWGVAGTAGQTPFQASYGAAPYPNYMGLGAARDARKILNKQLAPPDNRRIVLDVDSEANATALPELIHAEKSADPQVIRNGNIGRKLGFDWYFDQNILSHSTVADGTITTNGAGNIAGAEVLSVTGATTPPAEGDVFYIAGDSQAYVVKANATLTSWPIAPQLRTGFAAGSAVTVIDSAVTSLAFHRDCFALAVRPLADIDGLGNRIETYVDDVSGLTMRLEVSRENKQTAFTFDILYGVGCPRPELGCRILG